MFQQQSQSITSHTDNSVHSDTVKFTSLSKSVKTNKKINSIALPVVKDILIGLFVLFSAIFAVFFNMQYAQAALLSLALAALVSCDSLAKNLVYMMRGKANSLGICAVLCVINILILLTKSPFDTPYYSHLFMLTAAMLFLPQATANIALRLKNGKVCGFDSDEHNSLPQSKEGDKLDSLQNNNNNLGIMSQNTACLEGWGIYYAVGFLTIAAAAILIGLSQGQDGVFLLCIISAGAAAAVGHECLAIFMRISVPKDIQDNGIDNVTFLVPPHSIYKALKSDIAAVRQEHICEAVVTEVVPIAISRGQAMYYCSSLYKNDTHYSDIHGLYRQLSAMQKGSDNSIINKKDKKIFTIYRHNRQAAALIDNAKVSAFTLSAADMQDLLNTAPLPKTLSNLTAVDAAKIRECYNSYFHNKPFDSVIVLFYDENVSAAILLKHKIQNFAEKMHAGGQNYLIIDRNCNHMHQNDLHRTQNSVITEHNLQKLLTELPSRSRITMYSKTDNGVWLLAQNANRNTNKNAKISSIFTPIAFFGGNAYTKGHFLCKNLTVAQNKNIFWSFIYNIIAALFFITIRQYYLFAPLVSIFASLAAGIHFVRKRKNIRAHL